MAGRRARKALPRWEAASLVAWSTSALVRVGLVAGALAGVAGRADPGGAAEGVDLQARVVGDRGQPRPVGVRPRLEQRVLQEGVAGLLDLGRLAGAGVLQAHQLDRQPL